MDCSQIIEPAFYVVGASSQGHGQVSGTRDRKLPGERNFFKNLSGGTGPGFLERMHFFRKPRILSAWCPGGEITVEAAG